MNKIEIQNKRKLRVKRKFIGSLKPRLIIFRSNRYIYAQIFDPKTRKALVGAGDLNKSTKVNTGTKTESAEKVGDEIAKKALKIGVKEVIFDRQGYKYHGRVKALAEKAREAGLKF